MQVMLLFFFIALVIVFFITQHDTTKKIKKYEEEVKKLRTELQHLKQTLFGFMKGTQVHPGEVTQQKQAPQQQAPPEKAVQQAPVQPVQPVNEAAPQTQPAQAASTQQEPSLTLKKDMAKATRQQPKPTKPPKPKKPKNELLVKLEKQFAENWIGMLGTILLILGLGFLGIYSALKFREEFRFLLLLGISAVLTVLYFVLRRKNFWAQIAVWMRSAAGAVFLFATLGAGFIPGLKLPMLNNLWYAIPVLSVGIAVNLFLATIGKTQVFASLHVLLSLISISFAPAGLTPMIIAAIVTLYGVILCFKEKWEYHLVMAVTCYFIFLIYLRVRIGDRTTLMNIGTIVATAIVNGTALLIHYREIYKEKKFEIIPFMVHMLTWSYMGIGILMFAPGKNWVAIPIFASALLIFFIARFAKKREIRWVYVTDTLVAQITAMMGCLSLFKWDVAIMPILTILCFEIILYIIVMHIEKHKLLELIGTYFLNTAQMALVITLFFNIDSKELIPMSFHSALLIITATGVLAFNLYNQYLRNPDDRKNLTTVLLKYIPVFIIGLGAVITLLIFNKNTDIEFHKKIPYQFIILGSIIYATFIKAEINHKIPNLIKNIIFHIIAYFGLIIYTLTETDGYIVASTAVMISLLFLMRYLYKNDIWGMLFGDAALAITIFIFTIINFSAYKFENDILINNATIAAGIMAAAFTAFYVIRQIHFKRIPKLVPTGLTFSVAKVFHQVLGGFIPLLIFIGYINLAGEDIPWASFINMEYLILIPVIILILIRSRFQAHGIGIGLLILLYLVPIIQWVTLYKDFADFKIYQTAAYVLPTFIMIAAAFKFSNLKRFSTYLRWPFIYLFYAHTMFSLYFFCKPFSPLISGVLWLIVAVINSEILRIFLKSDKGSLRIRRGLTDFHVYMSSYALMIAYVIRHILVHLQSEVYLLPFFKARLLIELFGIAIFFYFLIQKKSEIPRYKIIRRIQPFFMELVTLSAILTVIVEVPGDYHPLIWIAGALLALYLGRVLIARFSRLQFYSLLLFYFSCFHVAFITSSYFTDPFTSFNLKWVLAVIAILVQFGYIVITHRKAYLDKVRFPRPVQGIAKMTGFIGKKKYWFIYYPLFITVALFLIWSFDKGLLTALLTTEAFIIFIISLILRENHFRYASMIGIVACVVRLVVYDLARENTLTRAIVCIAVAVLLILMNLMYNKYKERFAKHE